MKFNLREKESFYHELEQFVRSGIAMPQAVDALLPDAARGAIRQNLKRLEKFFRQGDNVPTAFANLRPAIGDMEVALISASSNSGKLDQALAYLSKYFGTLAMIRASVIRQLAWPILELHIGVLLLGIVHQITATGGISLTGYLLDCGKTLGVFYVIGFGLWLIVNLIREAARVSKVFDRILRLVPLVGRLRRNLALSRFCATYEMQLRAGINIREILQTAAEASQSALIKSDVERILPQVLGGLPTGELLANANSFPAAFRRVMRIGEQTGSLDDDLQHWADYYQKAAFNNLQTISAWIPKLIFLGIAAYLGYSIVTAYGQVLQGYDKALDF